MDFLKNAKRLPVIDWNLTFFGAHEQTVPNNWYVPAEKHYAFECIYVISGIEQVEIQHHVYRLTQGDFVLIPPEFLHKAAAENQLTYFCFHFDIDDPNLKVQLIQGLTYYHSAHSKLGNAISSHLNRLDDLIHEGGFDFNTKMIIQIELSKILQLFYNSATKVDNHTSSTAVEYSRMIADYLKNSLTNQILSYIKSGYISDRKSKMVESAIKQVGISDGYGFRIFKQTYGVSPRKYLSKLKINEAKKLLIKPQYSISDISTSLGYTNLANFSRQFKRWHNVSPNQWRKMQENSQDRNMYTKKHNY